MVSQWKSFLRDTVNNYDICSQGHLVFICSYIIAVIPSFDRNVDLSFYFLFHSHSKNNCSISTCKTGFSVLLKFPNISEIEKYLEVAYETCNHSYPVYFQFQCLKCFFKQIKITVILLTLKFFSR